MKILVKTFFKGVDYTLSRLSIDGVYKCDTLEDVVRHLPNSCPNTPRGLDCKCPEKVWGKTAIPAGTYECELIYSTKFQQTLLHLLNVPHFIGILVHAGNTAEDTHGCLLVGENKVKGKVINSRVCLAPLNLMFRSAKDVNEKIYLTIER